MIGAKSSELFVRHPFFRMKLEFRPQASRLLVAGAQVRNLRREPFMDGMLPEQHKAARYQNCAAQER